MHVVRSHLVDTLARTTRCIAGERKGSLGQKLVRLGVPDVHVNPIDDPKELIHVGGH